MDNNLKIKGLQATCISLLLLILFLFICIYGLRQRADNLQIQLSHYIKVEEQNLSPCPICGKEATIKPTNDYLSFYMECDKNNGCGLKTGKYDSIKELIEQWDDIMRSQHEDKSN